MKKYTHFEILNEAIALPWKSLRRQQKKVKKAITFKSASGNVYQSTLPDWELEGIRKDSEVFSIIAMVTLAEPCSRKVSKELKDFLYEYLGNEDYVTYQIPQQ